MSRKDYVAMAQALASVKPKGLCDESVNRAALVQWKLDLHAISNVLGADNRAFDANRFLHAAGFYD